MTHNWPRRLILGSIAPVLGVLALALASSLQPVSRFLPGVMRDARAPGVPADLPRPALLIFSKTKGFRHTEAIPAANAALSEIASKNGWGVYQTESSAAFTPEHLARFAAVVFNNVSGDVFTSAQREALKRYLQSGGGFVGFHGSGGDPSYDWQWYAQDVIGAQFIGHPLGPQFQDGVVLVEDRTHPATRALPERWRLEDEWYSFAASPRARPGLHVLATLDETSYANRRGFDRDLSMGADHPIAWWHCVGAGRVIYSAIGHQDKTYALPEYRAFLEGATRWAIRLDGTGCEDGGKATLH